MTDLPKPFVLPRNDLVVVLPDPTPGTSGLIAIPDSLAEKLASGNGTVLAAGPYLIDDKRKHRTPSPLQPGMRVAWNPAEGTELSSPNGGPAQLLISAKHLCPYEAE